MTADELHDEIAARVFAAGATYTAAEACADALMPAAKAFAAAQVRDAADGQDCYCDLYDDYGLVCPRHDDTADDLRARADALEAQQ